MPILNKNLGVGAVVLVPTWFLHPKKLVSEVYGENELANKLCEDLLVYGSGMRKIIGKEIFSGAGLS